MAYYEGKFTAKAYSYIYEQEIYLRAYQGDNEAGQNPHAILSYGGVLSGIKKDLIPSILVNPNMSVAYGVFNNCNNIADVRNLDGYCWDMKVLTYENTNSDKVDVYIGVLHLNYSQHGYNAYKFFSYNEINGVKSYAELTSWDDNVDTDWTGNWTLMPETLYFYIYNTGVAVNNSVPIHIELTKINESNGFYNQQQYLTSGSGQVKTITDEEEIPDPIDPEDLTDPYEKGGYSQGSGGEPSSTAGGTGSFSYTSDPIDYPATPNINASITGLITIYSPTLAQIRALADYMWGTPLDIESFKKIVADPMDCILGLSIVPVNVPTTGAQDICIGNILSTVQANVASTQYVWLDCGQINIKEFYGAYLDYAPYTKIDLYLPFVGSVTLNVDDVMGKTIEIKYLVDILSGSFMCFVKSGESILYNFSGCCSSMVPITGNNWSDLYKAVAQMGAIAVSAGIAGAGAVAGAVGSSAGEAVSGSVTGDFLSIGKDVAVGSASAVMSSKPSVQKSGSLGGSVGQLGVKYPYLTLTVPRQCLPVNQNKINGYPSYVYSNLAELHGFTVVQNGNFENMSCNVEERREITALLASGVIL